MHDSPSIGPRIAIRGATGSGKTILGHTLGQRCGLPVAAYPSEYAMLVLARPRRTQYGKTSRRLS